MIKTHAKRFPKSHLMDRKPVREREKRMRLIVDYLEKNARAPIMQIARDLGIPKSTVFDYLKEIKFYYDFTIVHKI